MGEVVGTGQRKLYLTRDQEHDLLLRYRAGDRRAGEQVVNSHYPMVLKAVAKFCGGNRYHPLWEDLLQEGQMGLMHSLDKFDLDKDFRFATYARWWVDARLQSFFLKNWSIVGGADTSTKNKMIFYAARRAKKKIEAGLENRTTSEIVDDLVERSGLDIRLVEKLWHRYTQGDLALDAPIPGIGETTFGDNLVDQGPLQDELYEQASLQRLRREGLQSAMEELNERQRTIIQRRLLAEDPATLRELGDELGITHERVRQIQERALALMRPHLEHLRDAVAA